MNPSKIKRNWSNIEQVMLWLYQVKKLHLIAFIKKNWFRIPGGIKIISQAVFVTINFKWSPTFVSSIIFKLL